MLMSGQVRSGVSATQLVGAAWRKSSHSGAVGNCIELAPVGGGAVAVRNSRDPNGSTLIYRWDSLMGLVNGARDGEYDGGLY
jgi:hypothetical protein